MPLDPNVPPHKTRPFWYMVAFAVMLAIGFTLAGPSHEAVWSRVVPSVITSIMLICIGWFAVRRAQRGENPGGSNTFRIVLLILAIMFFILALIFKRHP